jgi:arylsulfatase A-like enzyme/tetratricopeptide (TPR) repeat protein
LRRRAPVGTRVLAAAALAVAGCGAQRGALERLAGQSATPDDRAVVARALEKRPRASLLFITIDTCRADGLGCLGNGRIRTPNLDALAARGVAFTQAVCQAPTTLPSHASIFTGLYPSAHGVRDNGRFRLSDEATTLAEVLRAAGYRTGAFVGAFPVAAQFGLAQGFEVFSDEMPRFSFRGRTAMPERPASEVTARAIEWLKSGGSGPFFAWVHYFDPHWPYEPPEPYATLYSDHPYEGEIAFVDAEIGRLVAALEDAGLADQTLVVAMSDHGEGLGEHLEFSHSVLVYDGTIRIPLVIGPAAPGAAGGAIVTSQTRSIDVMPTALDLLGVAAPEKLDGVSLLAGGVVAPASRLSYLETYTPWYGFQWSPLRGLRSDGWKYIEAPRSELYDLQADPREGTNLLDRDAGRRSDWRRALAEIGAERGASTETDMDAETVEKLRSLGYVGMGRSVASSRPRGADAGLPNPMELIDAYFYFLAPAAGHFGHGEFTDAIALCDSALAHDPTNLQALVTRSHALYRLGRLDEAKASYERILALDPENVGAHFSLAAIAHGRGDYEAAERGYRFVLSVNPGIVEARHDLALTLNARGRAEEAETLLREAVAADPGFASAHRTLGRLCMEQGRRREALAAYLDGLIAEPTNRGLEGAVLALVADDTLAAGALSDLEEAHRANPGSEGTRLALIEVAYAVGEKERARALLSEGLAEEPSAALHRLRAWMHRREGRDDLAARDLEEAVRVEPRSAVAHANLGAFYRSLGQLEEAKREYDAALEIDARFEPALVGLGNIFAERRQLGRAIGLWERAVLENPDSAARENLETARRMLAGGGTDG